MIDIKCSNCGQPLTWCSVYTACALNKGNEHRFKTAGEIIDEIVEQAAIELGMAAGKLGWTGKDKE